MKNLVFVIIVILVTGLISCSGSGKVHEKYFADLIIGSNYEFIGRYAFNPVETPRTNSWRIEYDSQKRPILVQHLRNGQLGYGTSNRDAVQTRISYYDTYELREFLNARGAPALDKTRAYSVRIDFDEQGRRVALTNYGRGGKPGCNSEGVVKYLWELDDKGRIIKSIGLIDTAAVAGADHTVGWETRSYDENGYISEIQNYDADGNRSVDYPKPAIYRTVNDSLGNPIEERYLDAAGNLFFRSGGMCSTSKNKYNDWGEKIEEICLDQNDTVSHLLNFHLRRDYYDKKGNKIKTTYHSLDGDPIITQAGSFSMAFYNFDDMGNVIEKKYLDPDSNYVVVPAGVRGVPHEVVAFNETGFPVENHYFDGDGNFARCQFGCCILKQEYSDAGYQTHVEFLDENSKPVPMMGFFEFASYDLKYDQFGNKIEMRSYDVDNKPVGNINRWVYDENNYLIEESYHNESGKLATDKKGIARKRFERDLCGNELSVTNYDAAGNIVK